MKAETAKVSKYYSFLNLHSLNEDCSKRFLINVPIDSVLCRQYTLV